LATRADGKVTHVRHPPSVYRRRRMGALAVLVGLGACAFAVGAVVQDDGASKPETATTAAVEQQLVELPGGGRRLFPDKRVVAFYGAPQDDALGVLGIGSPASAGRKLLRQARPYARKTRPVLPAMELIVTIANRDPGADGLYITRQDPAVIDRYLAAARRIKALLILDIQPGRAGFVSEMRRLQRWLVQPDVGLALDPEWHVAEGQVPGQVIGSVDASDVDAVQRELAQMVTQRRLPEKLLLVHQFTEDMVRDKATLRRRPGVALTFNVDGFGDRPNKISKYEAFTNEPVRFNDGFKLFYEEDTNLMSPGAVLALGPPPDVVVYE
jgi:hypothetical protein